MYYLSKSNYNIKLINIKTIIESGQLNKNDPAYKNDPAFI